VGIIADRDEMLERHIKPLNILADKNKVDVFIAAAGHHGSEDRARSGRNPGPPGLACPHENAPVRPEKVEDRSRTCLKPDSTGFSMIFPVGMAC